MQRLEAGCNCSNIKIRGNMLRPTCKPNIPPTERMRFSKCAGCFMVQQKSIEIADMSKIASKSYSQYCSDMVCTNCNTPFRLFYARDTAFIGRLQRGAEPSISTDKSDPIPPQVRKLFAQPVKKDPDAAADGPRLDSDTGMEMMFGNNVPPVVGSYKENTIMPKGELDAVVSENVSKSYFA